MMKPNILNCKTNLLLTILILILHFTAYADIIQEIKNNNYAEVKKLIEQGAELNYENVFRVSPLLTAVMENNADIVKLLLENGADPNAISYIYFEDIEGKYSALMIAVYNNNFEITKLLVENKAEINYSDDFPSALLLAVLNQNIIMLKFLLENGASLDSDNLEFRYDYNKFKNTYWDNSVIVIAARNRDYDILNLLLSKGISINFRGRSSESALVYAVDMEDLKLVNYILDQGADVNYTHEYRSSKYVPALGIAVENKSYEIIKFLLDNGADINVRNYKKQTSVDIALLNFDFHALKILFYHDIDVTYSYLFRNFFFRLVFLVFVLYLFYYKKRNLCDLLLVFYPYIPKKSSILLDSFILLALIFMLGKNDIMRYLTYQFSGKSVKKNLKLYIKEKSSWDNCTDLLSIFFILYLFVFYSKIITGDLTYRIKGDLTDDVLIAVEVHLLLTIVLSSLMILRRPTAFLSFILLIPLVIYDFFSPVLIGSFAYILYLVSYIKSNKRFNPKPNDPKILSKPAGEKT
jgi:ankyrin repeat protein